MWDFTTKGFTSAVEYNPPKTSYNSVTKKYEPVADRFAKHLPEDYQPATDSLLCSHLLVRARVEADLDKLCEYDPQCYRFEDKTADYQFRVIIRREAYATFLYNEAMEIDYTSHVKETINTRAPKVVGGRYPALSAIWSACAKWQPVPPYGGGYSIGSTGKATVTHYGTGYKGPGSKASTTPKASGASGSGEKKNYLNAADIAALIDEQEQEQWEREDRAKSLEDVFKDMPSPTEWPDPDDVWPDQRLDDEWLEDQGFSIVGEPTRNTMIGQVNDLLREFGEDTDVEAVVDDLIERFGTVDLDPEATTGTTKVPFDDLWDTIVQFKINNFVDHS